MGDYVDIALAILGLLVLGGGVGVLSAALGVGGGVLMVPAFSSLIPGMDMNTAKGTSLLIIIFVASFNSWRMNRGDMKSPWSLAITLAAGSLVGGYLGAYLTGKLNDSAVTWIFISLLAFAGFRALFLKQTVVHEDEVRRRQILTVVIGFGAGFVAGATGTGGGAVFVPFVLWAGLCSNERVVALSNTVMVATAFASTIGHLFGESTFEMDWTVGQVNFMLAPCVFLGAIATAPLGRAINRSLSFERRRVVMGGLLLLITARLLYRVLA